MFGGQLQAPMVIRTLCGGGFHTVQPATKARTCARKCAGLTHKLAHRDPAALSARTVLDMATVDGARAIGQGDRLGSLEPGKQADLFVFDPLHARSTPALDPVASLVFSAGQEGVTATVVVGQVALDEGRVTTADEPALLQECQAAAAKAAQRAGTTRLLGDGRQRFAGGRQPDGR